VNRDIHCKVFSVMYVCTTSSQPIRAGARWLEPPPPSLDVGPQIYNTLDSTHGMYVNKNIELFNKFLQKNFLQHQHNV